MKQDTQILRPNAGVRVLCIVMYPGAAPTEVHPEQSTAHYRMFVP